MAAAAIADVRRRAAATSGEVVARLRLKAALIVTESAAPTVIRDHLYYLVATSIDDVD